MIQSITALTCTQTALTLAKQLDVASLEFQLTSANTQPGCSIQMTLCFISPEKRNKLLCTLILAQLGLQRYTGVPVHRDICATIRISYIEQAIAIFTIHLHICINKYRKALSSISAHPPSAF